MHAGSLPSRALLISALASALLVAGPAAARPRKPLPPPPVHPDTLPTLIRAWSLPASLAPRVTNTYAPRLTVDGDVVYVYDHNGRRLVAARVKTGKVLWHVPVPSESDRAFAFTPFVRKGRVYVGSDGHFFGFDTDTGRQRMDVATKGIAVNGVARNNHRLLLPWIRTQGRKALPGVSIWAVNPRRRRVDWGKKLPGTMAFVAGDARGGYVVADTGQVLALSADRGDLRWQVRVEGLVHQPPAFIGGRLYVTAVRRKGSRAWTTVNAVSVAKGALLYSVALRSARAAVTVAEGRIVVAEPDGRMTILGTDGKEQGRVDLRLGDEPRTMALAAAGKRAYVFTSHQDGNGYVRLVDLEARRVLATANALDADVRSLTPAGKMVLLDAADGTVHAYWLDRSKRPVRDRVPATEFAQGMIAAAARATSPLRGLPEKLAGLGKKALPVIERALAHANPHVVVAAAGAVALLDARRATPALLKALRRLEATPAGPSSVDPLRAVVDALASLRDGRAARALSALANDARQDHRRRRAAYVALGAIGTPAALKTIWAHRAALALTSYRFAPQPYTPSLAYKVQDDVTETGWPEAIRKATSVTAQAPDGTTWVASLSGYLGSYNDIWIGRADISGAVVDPIFTGLAVPEVAPGRRVRFKRFTIGKGGKVTLAVELRRGEKGWVSSRPITFALEDLRRDSDGDGLTDAVERRLRTCVHHADCDGDGLKDSEDVNPLASAKLKATPEQRLFREAFFTFYSFLSRRGLVVVDPGDGPSFELYGRKDPVLSLRRSYIDRLQAETGRHAIDYVSFGGPYPEGSASADALPKVVWDKRKRNATIGMDVVRSGENAVAFNVSLKKVGRNWVVTRMVRVWGTR